MIAPQEHTTVAGTFQASLNVRSVQPQSDGRNSLKSVDSIRQGQINGHGPCEPEVVMKSSRGPRSPVNSAIHSISLRH
jgi:hypothetical protein